VRVEIFDEATMTGLVLTAGGARGAYQAGVLRRIGEIPRLRRQPSPFPIVAGASAGAINGSMIAAMSGDFPAATRTLGRLWSEVRVKDVFRTDPLTLGWNGLRLLRDLSLGPLTPSAGAGSLLNAAPLRSFLVRLLPLGRIAESIRRGHLYAVAVTATSYHSGKSYTFVQGRPGHPLWVKSRRVTMAVDLTIDHVLASAAIPIVFQPVRLRIGAGEFWFGDGGLRLVTPLSPAIRLGASRLLAIGVRCSQAAADLSRAELGASEEAATMPQPPLSQICGVFLNAIFLDHLDADVDHLIRMNELIQAHAAGAGPQPAAPRAARAVSEPMRIVRPLVIGPSEDLAMVAARKAHRMPRLIRHLMEGLGSPDAQSADLMSYLLFDAAYTRELVEIGYRDCAARIDEIDHLLAPPEPSRAAARRRPAAREKPPFLRSLSR
jgi:NTE family protein